MAEKRRFQPLRAGTQYSRKSDSDATRGNVGASKRKSARSPERRPVPTGARIVVKNGKKIAHWTVGGQECSAEFVETKNGPRIVVESEYFIARYTDAAGRFRERSTGCRDRRAAEHKLNGWLQEAEKVKAGILSQEEFEVGRRLAEPVEKHLVDFE